MSKGKHTIFYILLLGLFLRLILPGIVLLHYNTTETFYARDTISYIKPAQSLISSGRFYTNGQADIIRTPGYSIFLILGILFNKLEIITIIFQVFISVLTIYLVYKITNLIIKQNKISILSALLFAFEPLSIIYSTKLLTETLFTLLVVLFVYELIKYIENGFNNIKSIIASSILLSASIYVRPINIYLPVLYSILMIFYIYKNKLNVKFMSTHLVAFLFVSLFINGAWQLRNSINADYRGFSAISDINLYFYQAAAVLAEKQDKSYFQVQDELGYNNQQIYFVQHPEQKNWTEGQRYRYMRDIGFQTIRHNPIIYLKIHVKGMLRTLFDPGAIELLKILKIYPESGGLLGDIIDQGIGKIFIKMLNERPLIFWSNFLMGTVLIFYLVGSILSIFLKGFIQKESVLIIFILVGYLFFLSGGPHSLNRFRQPIMPFICIFAAVGLFKLWNSIKACSYIKKLTCYFIS